MVTLAKILIIGVNLFSLIDGASAVDFFTLEVKLLRISAGALINIIINLLLNFRLVHSRAAVFYCARGEFFGHELALTAKLLK